MRSEQFWDWFDGFAAPKLNDREKTFRKMFEHLDAVGGRGPVRIVETGGLEEPDNWLGNGCSTIIFDRYAQTHPGSSLRSIEIDPAKCAAARQHVSYNTILLCGDSVETLKRLAAAKDELGPLEAAKIDLLYLDASHLDWNHQVPTQLHHLNELMAAMPLLRAGSLVVVDDSPAVMDEFPRLEIGGKGALIARYAFSVGADLAFLNYQVGWTNMTRIPAADEQTIEDLIRRARAHVEADRMTAADPLYRLMLSLTLAADTSVKRVARGEACMHFAKLCLTKNRFGMAGDWYAEALRADPRAVDYRIDLAAKCLYQIGAVDAAVAQAAIATRIEPENPEAWHALGALWHAHGDLKRAAEAYDKEIETGKDASAALNRATVALDAEDYGLVLELCASCAKSDRAADALHVLAMAAFRQDQHENAVELFDLALARGCRDPGVVRWHKSMAMECLGMYPEAWAEREGRADQSKEPQIAIPYKRFGSRPLWDGGSAWRVYDVDEPIVIPESFADGQDATERIQGLINKAGRKSRIHVHAEAGAGDNIAMMRYLPALVEMGFEVCYETTAELLDLARQSFPEVEVVRNALDYPGAVGLKDFDCHVPIGGLQKAFGATIDNPGWRGPYIQVDAEKEYAFDKQLPGRRCIGLCWSSGIRLGLDKWLEKYGRQKSMDFDTISPLLDLNGPKAFVSLQVGPERDQLDFDDLREGRIFDILPDKPNWTDTAALIACLDLVITVDTAVAHLAGAMGKPVWVLVPIGAGGSWHWMSKRPGAPWNERSPWYPSARVFRQKTPGDWGSVIEEVARALGESECLEKRLVG